MRNLNDMNDLYNVQDVIFLCEIFENRFQMMHEKLGFNPRKCNSASTLSSCVQRNKSKVITALPTSNNIVKIFEKTLAGRFSFVNTRLAFNTEILMLNLSSNDYSKLNIDQNFKAYKRDDLKVTRFGNRKMSMSSKDFVYDMIDAFCFPDRETQKIYDRNEINVFCT